jgi:hypothetical protein
MFAYESVEVSLGHREVRDRVYLIGFSSVQTVIVGGLRLTAGLHRTASVSILAAPNIDRYLD